MTKKQRKKSGRHPRRKHSVLPKSDTPRSELQTLWRLCPSDEDIFSVRSVCVSRQRVWEIVVFGKFDPTKDPLTYFRDPLPAPTPESLPPPEGIRQIEQLIHWRKTGDNRFGILERGLKRRMDLDWQPLLDAYWQQVTSMYPETFSGARLGEGREGPGYYYDGVCAFTRGSEASRAHDHDHYPWNACVKFLGKVIEECPEGVVAKPVKVLSWTRY